MGKLSDDQIQRQASNTIDEVELTLIAAGIPEDRSRTVAILVVSIVSKSILLLQKMNQ